MKFELGDKVALKPVHVSQANHRSVRTVIGRREMLHGAPSYVLQAKGAPFPAPSTPDWIDESNIEGYDPVATFKSLLMEIRDEHGKDEATAILQMHGYSQLGDVKDDDEAEKMIPSTWAYMRAASLYRKR